MALLHHLPHPHYHLTGPPLPSPSTHPRGHVILMLPTPPFPPPQPPPREVHLVIASRQDPDLPATISSLSPLGEVHVLEDVQGLGPAQTKMKAWLRLSLPPSAFVIFSDSHCQVDFTKQDLLSALHEDAVTAFDITNWESTLSPPYSGQLRNLSNRRVTATFGPSPRGTPILVPFMGFVGAPQRIWTLLGGPAPGLVGYGFEEQWLSLRCDHHSIPRLSSGLPPVRHRFKSSSSPRFRDYQDALNLNLLSSLLSRSPP